MSADDIVLSILAGSEQPLGWYGIEIRLGKKGILLEENLMSVLKRLQEKQLIKHEAAEGYPHGVYKLTADGQRLVGQG